MPVRQGGRTRRWIARRRVEGVDVDRGQTRELVTERDAAPSVATEIPTRGSRRSVRLSPATASRSQGSARGGTRATASSRSRAARSRLRTAREHGVADCRRHRRTPAARTSVTKNALPPVSRCRASGVESDSPQRELADGPARERSTRDPGHGGGGRQLAQQELQRMRAGELVVAVGRDHERLCVADPPAEDTQDVERRLVAPVHVLEHQDGRLLAQPRVKGAEQSDGEAPPRTSSASSRRPPPRGRGTARAGSASRVGHTPPTRRRAG